MAGNAADVQEVRRCLKGVTGYLIPDGKTGGLPDKAGQAFLGIGEAVFFWRGCVSRNL